MNKISASIDQNEVDKFSIMADEWWDPNGKLKTLHHINPIRIEYIIDTIKNHYKIDDISNLSLLDIGCGGGLLSENFARLGCKVTAIDASEKNILIAKAHASKMNLDINYRNITVEQLALENNKWNIILNMEVIEHVGDVNSFMKSSSDILSDDGIMFISTLNKNLKSYLLAVVAAEYILRWLPIGTHDYNKFLKPSDICSYLRDNNLTLKEIKGMSYNLFSRKWYISDNIDVNYIVTALK